MEKLTLQDLNKYKNLEFQVKNKSSLGDILFLSKGFMSYNVVVGTTPTRVIDRLTYVSPYLIVNPSRYLGLTSITTLINGTITANYNTQSSLLATSAFQTCHLHLNVTAVTGSWEFISQSYDSVSATWADVEVIFPDIIATGSRYFLLNQTGVASNLAIKVNELSSGSITCTLVATLKGGSGIGDTSFSQIIYLGNSSLTTSSGFPLLPGDRQPIVVGENVELYGIAENNLNLRILKL